MHSSPVVTSGSPLMFVTRLDAAAPRDRVIRSAVAIVAGVVLCVMGLLLERACKVPTEPDEGEEAGEETAWRQTHATKSRNPRRLSRPRHMVTSVTSPAIASRGLKASPLQRISEIVLITGTVAAAATAAGPPWLVRLGVATAIMSRAGGMRVRLARAQQRSTRAGADAMLKASREAWCRAAEERISERRGRRRLGPADSGRPAR